MFLLSTTTTRLLLATITSHFRMSVPRRVHVLSNGSEFLLVLLTLKPPRKERSARGFPSTRTIWKTNDKATEPKIFIFWNIYLSHSLAKKSASKLGVQTVKPYFKPWKGFKLDTRTSVGVQLVLLASCPLYFIPRYGIHFVVYFHKKCSFTR